MCGLASLMHMLAKQPIQQRHERGLLVPVTVLYLAQTLPNSRLAYTLVRTSLSPFSSLRKSSDNHSYAHDIRLGGGAVPILSFIWRVCPPNRTPRGCRSVLSYSWSSTPPAWSFQRCTRSWFSKRSIYQRPLLYVCVHRGLTTISHTSHNQKPSKRTMSVPTSLSNTLGSVNTTTR
jgi:hypothetical protein